MAREFEDSVQDVATSTGTGSFVMAGTPPQTMRPFSVHTVGATFEYKAFAGAQWEIGDGTWDGSSIARSPRESSNGGALVNFTTAPTVWEVVTSATARDGFTNPRDPGFDIVLCCGQSNMVGAGTISAVTDVADSRVLQFATNPSDASTYQKLMSGADPLRYPLDAAGSIGLGPGSWFSKTYASMVPSNRKVLLVPVAQGGQSLVYAGGAEVKWAPGNPGSTLYEMAIAQANAAIAAALLLYPNSRFVGTIWLQGESDGDWMIAKATYKAALKTLIAGFRSRITGAANSWFVIGGMVAEAIAGRSGYPNIRDAHIETANETAKCTYVPSISGYQNGDNLHYNAQGARMMGCAMASAVPAAKLATGITVPAAAVTLTRGASSGYVGSPVTITVGTDNPLTGSQTESVQLTSNIAGTFSVNPVTINASTQPATSVFTPSVAGAATITGTATGTPSLTAGTVAYTSNAITAPAQMAAPVATAGITSASLAFTLPANGGHAVTGLTITPYIAGVAQSAINTATLTSPYNVTGLTANTAYTFRMHASNDIGPGADSVDSNSATPTASATVPVAPTIGVAVAGDGYVDVAFTRNSNGGSAVIDSTATLSTGQTATGTTSPIRVTAPNGTAVTATVKDRNGVGSSAASAASNSVTPVAAGPALTKTRLTTVSNLAEGGTGPDYTYSQATAVVTYGSTPMGGQPAQVMAADGTVQITLLTTPTGRPMLSLNTSSGLKAFATTTYSLFANSAGYTNAGSGTWTSGTTGIIPATGDVMRLRRVGTTITAEVSKDSGNTWTAIGTFAASAGTLYIQAQSEYGATFTVPAATGVA